MFRNFTISQAPAAALLAILLCAASIPATAASDSPTTSSRLQKVMPLLREDKFDTAASILKEWESASPDDPDLAAAKANYLLALPETQSHLDLQYDPDTTNTASVSQDGSQFTLIDPETSKPVGFLGQVPGKNRDTNMAKALEILNVAGAKHPQRIDIRLGAIHIYKEQENYTDGFDKLKSLVEDASKTSYTGLLWMENKPAPTPEETISGTVHSFYTSYIRSDSPDDKLAFRIATLGTTAFPKDVRHWNDLAAEHFQKGDPEKALESFNKAHAVDPKDCLILMNIAHLYTETGKPDKAIAEYEKVIKMNNDEELVEAAKESIKELKAAKKPN